MEWTVASGEIDGFAYLIVRRGGEDIATAVVDPSRKGGLRDIEFSDPTFQKSNRTRVKAIDMLSDAVKSL